MKKFFCYGKKDFCDNEGRCNGCGFIDNSGGEYREFLITNADRIRAMTDEELAEFLYQVGYNHRWGLKEYTLEWLKQPAEEDGHA